METQQILLRNSTVLSQGVRRMGGCLVLSVASRKANDVTNGHRAKRLLADVIDRTHLLPKCIAEADYLYPD